MKTTDMTLYSTALRVWKEKDGILTEKRSVKFKDGVLELGVKLPMPVIDNYQNAYIADELYDYIKRND